MRVLLPSVFVIPRNTVTNCYSKPKLTFWLRSLLPALLLVTCLYAQSDTRTPAAKSPEPHEQEQSSHRVAGVVPAFNAVNDINAPALRTSQKFHLFTKTIKDPYNLVMPAINAIILSAGGASTGYGSGASGFAKRYAASIADSVSGNFFRLYAYPALLHEDPRYFRAGQESLGKRCWHVFGATLRTRKDDGTFRFNWSKLLATGSSSALSNLYYPSENRGTKLTLSRIGLSYLGEAGLNALKEFWPDISRKK